LDNQGQPGIGSHADFLNEILFDGNEEAGRKTVRVREIAWVRNVSRAGIKRNRVCGRVLLKIDNDVAIKCDDIRTRVFLWPYRGRATWLKLIEQDFDVANFDPPEFSGKDVSEFVKRGVLIKIPRSGFDKSLPPNRYSCSPRYASVGR
jgi:hypothetical protein